MNEEMMDFDEEPNRGGFGLRPCQRCRAARNRGVFGVLGIEEVVGRAQLTRAREWRCAACQEGDAHRQKEP